ncbi:bacillithiol biosynthesis cysteine-adding enzyme BshC [Algoriphagus sediminis]|uniref:Putative cysteine ligase BshC n=1 Tax=Algoriphagus sediminis TaxID=3057113 RepID=A0ABT7YES0_9BACT|nr:bacillithiol biosynthesis cysteine-adding enzyme BshC [Algoriphagus sediminis]MDN3205022.1 bacillithiol biosynthesis cysteine-adding enzyme BshC [Algoriphagus sediminis]
MKKTGIDLKDTNQFSQFFLDYLEGKEELREFYTHRPELGSFKEAIENKTLSPESREILQSVLREQYSDLELEDAVKSNIDALTDPNTFTVTTGHQLNLFTGPLYFVYKIVSTINLAKKLEQTFPEKRIVPVYWMATEDHDFDEINYFKMDGEKYQWNSDQQGAVGDFKLDASFKAFLKEVSFASPVFLDAYKSSKTLAEAVLKYVNSFFGEYGLVVIDADNAQLKASFSDVIVKDLFDHTPFQKATETSERLEQLGYKSQIFPREINFFYLAEGCRERIEKVGDTFKVLNTDLSFSEEEMKKLISDHPERFSPNVVLRPLYQETILPNVAYLGGPAEVVYWLQLKEVFQEFETPFPVLLPRNFGLLLEPRVVEKIKAIGWEFKDIFQDLESWKAEYVRTHAQVELDLENERVKLEEIYDEAGKSASKLEKSLMDAFQAGKVRSLKILDQMSAKLRKAEKKRHDVLFDRVEAIRDYAYPGGSPQERVVNMQQFYLARPELIEEIIEAFDPLDFKMWILEL